MNTYSIFSPGSIALMSLGFADLIGVIPSWMALLMCIASLFIMSLPFLVRSR